MKACPLGHENSDDATTCTVCLRKLPTEPVALDLFRTGAATVVTEAGATTALSLGLRQHGGEAMHCALSASGTNAGWVAPAVITSAPGRTVEVTLTVTVPTGAGAGARELTVQAQPVDREGTTARTVIQLQVAAPRQDTAITQDTTIAHDATSTPPADPPPQPVWTRLERPTTDAPAISSRERFPPAPQPPAPQRRQPPPRPREQRPRSPHAPEVSPRPLRTRHVRRRRGRPAAAVVVAIGVVLVAALVMWQVLDRDLTPQSALELSEDEALDELLRLWDQDRAELNDFLGTDGAFALQLSSKCRGFEEVDLTGPDGIGSPDGVPEQFPGGLGDTGILAFHLGIGQSRGTTLLTIADDLGDPRPCDDGTARWITLHLPAADPFDSPQEALCGCAERGLPFGECGARGSDGSIVFWLPDTVPDACRELVGSISGAPPLG